MKRACIATVDAARARIYTFQDDAEPGREMREVLDLTNPGRRSREGELFSESRPPLAPSGHMAPSAAGAPVGPGRGTAGGPGKDDHRDDHIAMMDQKFAKEICEELDKVVRAGGYGHLILIAPPKMLGQLRKANGVFHRPGLVIDEVTRDLSNLTAPQLHDHLASLGLIPARQRAAFQAAR